MGLPRRAAFAVLLLVAGCAPQGNAPVAVPQMRSSGPIPVIPTDPKVVSSVAATLAGLDSNVYHAVSMAQVGRTVLLTGAVVRPDQRRLVEQRVASVSGVAHVTNRIIVTDAASLETYLADGRKERELAGVLAPNLAVRVVHNVVYVVGTAEMADIDQLKVYVADDPAIQWVDATAVTYGAE